MLTSAAESTIAVARPVSHLLFVCLANEIARPHEKFGSVGTCISPVIAR